MMEISGSPHDAMDDAIMRKRGNLNESDSEGIRARGLIYISDEYFLLKVRFHFQMNSGE